MTKSIASNLLLKTVAKLNIMFRVKIHYNTNNHMNVSTVCSKTLTQFIKIERERQSCLPKCQVVTSIFYIYIGCGLF